VLEALPERFGRRAQVDDPAFPAHQRAIVLTQHRAAACGNYSIHQHDSPRQRFALQSAEGFLAALREQLGDGLPRHPLNISVKVCEEHSQPLGDQFANGGLAAAHGADQVEMAYHMNRDCRNA
jgi:hypothetical protein